MSAAQGLLVIISGPSGVGKTTITHAVRDGIDGAVLSVSATTRSMRAGEAHGVDYSFISDAEFDAMIERDEFLEWADVHGARYGTPRPWVDAQRAEGRTVILEIDVQGAEQVKRAMPDAVGLFVLPPSEDELLARLRGRRREGEDEIQRRFAKAKEEIARARASGVYEHSIVNADLDAAIDEALAIVRAAKDNAPA